MSETYRRSTAVESRSSLVSRWYPLFADGPAAVAVAVAAEPAWLRWAPTDGTEVANCGRKRDTGFGATRSFR